MSKTDIDPTRGDRPNGSAEISGLCPDGTLQESGQPAPIVVADPDLVTVDTPSATIARPAEMPRLPAVPPQVSDPGAEATKAYHPSDVDDQIETLRMENASLAAEVAELRRTLTDSQAARAEAIEWIGSLTAQLEDFKGGATPTDLPPNYSGTLDTEQDVACYTLSVRDEAHDTVSW